VASITAFSTYVMLSICCFNSSIWHLFSAFIAVFGTFMYTFFAASLSAICHQLLVPSGLHIISPLAPLNPNILTILNQINPLNGGNFLRWVCICSDLLLANHCSFSLTQFTRRVISATCGGNDCHQLINLRSVEICK